MVNTSTIVAKFLWQFKMPHFFCHTIVANSTVAKIIATGFFATEGDSLKYFVVKLYITSVGLFEIISLIFTTISFLCAALVYTAYETP